MRQFLLIIFLVTLGTALLSVNPLRADDYEDDLTDESVSEAAPVSIPRAHSRQGNILAGGGGGLLLNPPVRGDINAIGEYYLWEKISLGLQFDMSFRGPTTFHFVSFGRYHFDLAALLDSHKLTRWDLYAGGGLGGRVNTDGAGLMDLMVPELGLRYEMFDWLTVGPNVSFHYLTNFSGSTWDFRVLFLQAEYRF